MGNKRLTAADYDKKINAADKLLDSLEKERSRIYSIKSKLERRKKERFDPEYRKKQEAIRKHRDKMRSLIEDANRKFAGKWLFVDDGEYFHIRDVRRPDESKHDVLDLKQHQIVFPIIVDVSLIIGDGEVSISMDESCKYCTLYADDTIIVSGQKMNEDLCDGLKAVSERYETLRKRFKWKKQAPKAN